jgi:hypothetical protein
MWGVYGHKEFDYSGDCNVLQGVFTTKEEAEAYISNLSQTSPFSDSGFFIQKIRLNTMIPEPEYPTDETLILGANIPLLGKKHYDEWRAFHENNPQPKPKSKK